MDSKNGELNVNGASFGNLSCFKPTLGGFSNGKQASDDQSLLQAQAQIWNQTFNFINSMSLKCAIELGIPDIIHNHAQPMTLPELLDALPINPSKAQHVHRLMRILSHSGFFAQREFGRDQKGYVLTHASHLLLRDNPLCISPFVLAMLDPCLTTPWQYMSSWFKNDDPTAFETNHGTSLWGYGAQDNPKFGRFFDEAMASDARLAVKMVIDHKEVFEGVDTLVDVGGGTGTMAKGIANAFPNMESTVLDHHNVIAGLEGTNNLKFIGGDMFEAIPPTNAILMKWILHDWSDENCVKILKNCKEAIVSSGAKKGKVIIIDLVVEKQNKDKETMETQLLWDMLMMVVVSGKERNEEEWAKLFASAGFSNYKINPILGLRSLIEVYP